MAVVLKGWKYCAFIAAFVGFTCLALYPVTLQPMMNPQKYKDIREYAARETAEKNIQSGNMVKSD